MAVPLPGPDWSMSSYCTGCEPGTARSSVNSSCTGNSLSGPVCERACVCACVCEKHSAHLHTDTKHEPVLSLQTRQLVFQG